MSDFITVYTIDRTYKTVDGRKYAYITLVTPRGINLDHVISLSPLPYRFVRTDGSWVDAGVMQILTDGEHDLTYYAFCSVLDTVKPGGSLDLPEPDKDLIHESEDSLPEPIITDPGA